MLFLSFTTNDIPLFNGNIRCYMQYVEDFPFLKSHWKENKGNEAT